MRQHVKSNRLELKTLYFFVTLFNLQICMLLKKGNVLTYFLLNGQFNLGETYSLSVY